MIRNQLYIALLLLAAACTGNPATGPGSAAGSTGALHFAFSNQKTVLPGMPGSEWCRVPFPEAAVINADPQNKNRRVFGFGSGPHRVTISYGNITASFVLLKTASQVDVFTSDNYPECLSNRVNFTISGKGDSFHYDNQKGINFDVVLVPMGDGTQIALDLDTEAGYGIVVRR